MYSKMFGLNEYQMKHVALNLNEHLFIYLFTLFIDYITRKLFTVKAC